MKKLSLSMVAALLTCTSIIVSASTWAASLESSESKAAVSTITQHKVSLNDASLDQLVLLKGVGEKKAQAIISYRINHGSFTSVKQLVNVKGIGEKIILDNKSILAI